MNNTAEHITTLTALPVGAEEFVIEDLSQQASDRWQPTTCICWVDGQEFGAQ